MVSKTLYIDFPIINGFAVGSATALFQIFVGGEAPCSAMAQGALLGLIAAVTLSALIFILGFVSYIIEGFVSHVTEEKRSQKTQASPRTEEDDSKKDEQDSEDANLSSILQDCETPPYGCAIRFEEPPMTLQEIFKRMEAESKNHDNKEEGEKNADFDITKDN